MIFLAKRRGAHYTKFMYKFSGYTLQLSQRAGKFLGKTDRGVTAIEYALIALLIAIPIIGGLFAIGGQLNTIFSHVNNGFTAGS
jgi:pilus assembly protein Flp/PilA